MAHEKVTVLVYLPSKPDMLEASRHGYRAYSDVTKAQPGRYTFNVLSRFVFLVPFHSHLSIPGHEETQRAATGVEGFRLSFAIRQREIVQASQPARRAAMHTDCIMKLRIPEARG